MYILQRNLNILFLIEFQKGECLMFDAIFLCIRIGSYMTEKMMDVSAIVNRLENSFLSQRRYFTKEVLYSFCESRLPRQWNSVYAVPYFRFYEVRYIFFLISPSQWNMKPLIFVRMVINSANLEWTWLFIHSLKLELRWPRFLLKVSAK